VRPSRGAWLPWYQRSASIAKWSGKYRLQTADEGVNGRLWPADHRSARRDQHIGVARENLAEAEYDVIGAGGIAVIAILLELWNRVLKL
jgi:hypothetical protein